MAIAFQNTGTGDGANMVPIVKYNAKAGRIYRIDRHNDGQGWVTDEIEITNEFSAVLDMENIEIGWMLFGSGQAPDFKLVPLGADPGARPTDKHKEGFRVMLKLGKAAAGEAASVRELATTAGSVKQAFSDLHDEYTAGAAANPGKLPVVKLTKVTPVTTTNGGQKQTNYAPEFAITQWVPRPPDLTFQPKAKANGNGAAPQQAATPPATGSTKAAPPPAQKQLATADEEWG